MKQITEIKLDGKPVGIVEGTKYTTYKNPNRHFYIKYKGYAISIIILKKLKKLNVKKIEIIEEHLDTYVRYTTTLEKYFEGIYIKHHKYDEQICVPVDEMTKKIILKIPKSL